MIIPICPGLRGSWNVTLPVVVCLGLRGSLECETFSVKSWKSGANSDKLSTCQIQQALLCLLCSHTCCFFCLDCPLGPSLPAEHLVILQDTHQPPSGYFCSAFQGGLICSFSLDLSGYLHSYISPTYLDSPWGFHLMWFGENWPHPPIQGLV